MSEVMCDGNNECFRIDEELSRVRAQRDDLLDLLRAIGRDASAYQWHRPIKAAIQKAEAPSER